MSTPDRSRALDHVVVALFENRSFDNVLGHLYGPDDGKTFEGVIGKNLSNPIPAWAEHGVDQELLPYTVAAAASLLAILTSDKVEVAQLSTELATLPGSIKATATTLVNDAQTAIASQSTSEASGTSGPATDVATYCGQNQ